MRENSQIKAIHKYLEDGHSLTSFEAFTMFRVTRLSAIIYLLKKRGCKIKTVQQVSVNTYGNTTHFAVYSLIKKEETIDESS